MSKLTAFILSGVISLAGLVASAEPLSANSGGCCSWAGDCQIEENERCCEPYIGEDDCDIVDPNYCRQHCNIIPN